MPVEMVRKRRGCILNRIIKEGITEKVTFEPDLKQVKSVQGGYLKKEHFRWGNSHD